MTSLTSHDLLALFLALGAILLLARLLGEVARRFDLPGVLGEIGAGILLGPTVLGRLAPELSRDLFPAGGNGAVLLAGMANVGIVLFLLVAGLEVDLSTMWRQGRSVLAIGIAGIAVPFLLGGIAGVALPHFFGAGSGRSAAVFPLFFATALSISALPVIARTLMDLHIFKTDLGMLIIAVAVFNDLVGWLVFAVVLSAAGAGETALGLGPTVLVTLGFTAAMLTVVRALLHRCLPWVLAHTSWPGGVLGFSLGCALFAAAFTEFLGLHALFGAFLFGVALGDSSHLRENTRATIGHFVSCFFAPLFFGSIGLRVDFAAAFDPLLCTFVFVLACAAKVLGCALAARWRGMPPREAWAVGFGLNARGSMEIVLGLLALDAGIIDARMFVALVVMALGTSLLSGPAMQRLLARPRPRTLASALNARAFLPKLAAADARSAIAELGRALAAAHRLDSAAVVAAAWEREDLSSTGVAGGLAVPHAHLAGLQRPLVAVGLSEAGVDFNAPDGQPAHTVFLVLTPLEDDGAQIELLAAIGRAFDDARFSSRVAEARRFTELLALLKIEAQERG